MTKMFWRVDDWTISYQDVEKAMAEYMYVRVVEMRVEPAPDGRWFRVHLVTDEDSVPLLVDDADHSESWRQN
jgi:hypothetical protein